MSSRPRAVLLLPPGLEERLFEPAVRAALLRLTEPAGPFLPGPGEPPDAGEALAEAEIAVTGWGSPRLDGALLARCPRLRFVAHAAGTVRDLVTPELFARGIRVVSAADANAIPVAEYALAAILLAGKAAFEIAARFRGERRQLAWHHRLPGIGNRGITVGIVGASRIGRRVIRGLRAVAEMEILVTDPYLDRDGARELGAELVSLDELLRRSRIVSLHAPALPTTRHMIGARELALLADGATLVNTARGSLVDPKALEAELVAGRLRAVLDVTEPEPLPPESPLYELPNVWLTPHIAGSAGNEIPRMAELAVAEIDRFVRGEALRHEVRPEDLERIA